MPKVDDIKLLELLKQGKTGQECAEFFGVGKSTISRHKLRIEKELNRTLALAKTDMLVKNAVEIREVDDLGVLVAQARRTMDLVETVIHGDDQDAYAAKSRLNRLTGGSRNLVGVYTAMLGELRKQLEFYFQMRERYLSMKKIEDYQTVVLQAIKEIDPDVARKIVSRLKEMRALHESVGVGE
jgi:energy-coupling factor transporter ATP-binding protein EcfA2